MLIVLGCVLSDCKRHCARHLDLVEGTFSEERENKKDCTIPKEKRMWVDLTPYWLTTDAETPYWLMFGEPGSNILTYVEAFLLKSV